MREGDGIEMGWVERKEVLEWIDRGGGLFGDWVKGVVEGIWMGGGRRMMVWGEKRGE